MSRFMWALVAEILNRFPHAGGRPTQIHSGIAASFHVAAHLANGPVHILNDAGVAPTENHSGQYS
jgi:hypothetical protein